MHMLVMPPGASAKPHYHEAHETAIYVLEGTAEMRHGPKLEHVMRVEAGDYIYIPAGVPHQPYNPTDKPVRAVIARTDPNEQESVVLLEEVSPRKPSAPPPRSGSACGRWRSVGGHLMPSGWVPARIDLHLVARRTSGRPRVRPRRG